MIMCSEIVNFGVSFIKYENWSAAVDFAIKLSYKLWNTIFHEDIYDCLHDNINI